MAPLTPSSFDYQASSSSSARPVHSAYPPRPSSSRYQSDAGSSKGGPSASVLSEAYDAYDEDETFDPYSIDPNLRLRTVRTAHSVIAESIRSEQEAEKRKHRRHLFRKLTRRGTKAPKEKKRKGSDADAKSQSGAVSDYEETAAPSSPRMSSVTFPAPEKASAGSSSGERQDAKVDKGKGKAAELPRRTIYVNTPLPSSAKDRKGEPLMRYVRNKVRTSKYTVITFIPKNLLEQFRRAANIYFLAMVILQVFSIFGAPNPEIGMLPLVFILGMTAVKDGIEDWRRSKLDNEVNNSAATKLGSWRNVNQPVDPRTFFEKLFGLNSELQLSRHDLH